MSPRQAFTSALHLFVVFAFFLAGLFFAALPNLPHVRTKFIDLLSDQTCVQVGVGFFFISLLLFFGFYVLNRGKFLVIKMGVSADLKVVRETVENWFSERFPKQIALKDLDIGSQSQLEFKIHLAPLEQGLREEILIEAEKGLTQILQKRFGYSKPFLIILNI